MRVGMVILALAAIGLGVVKIRKDEVVALREIQQFQTRLIEQRRTLQAQQVRLAELKAMDALRSRAEDMGLSLVLPASEPPPAPPSPRAPVRRGPAVARTR